MRETPHGTMNGYTNFYCRCGKCVQAARDWREEHQRIPCPGGCGRMILRDRGRPGQLCRACWIASRTLPLTHGTVLGYRKGCRCVECTAASATVRRERRKRARERK